MQLHSIATLMNLLRNLNHNEYELEGIVPELQSVITTLRNVYFYQASESVLNFALPYLSEQFAIPLI